MFFLFLSEEIFESFVLQIVFDAKLFCVASVVKLFFLENLFKLSSQKNCFSRGSKNFFFSIFLRILKFKKGQFLPLKIYFHWEYFWFESTKSQMPAYFITLLDVFFFHQQEKGENWHSYLTFLRRRCCHVFPYNYWNFRKVYNKDR